MNKKITFVLVLALLLRLSFVYFQFSGDVKNHIVWGHSLLESGPSGMYPRHFSGFNDVNYPPLTVLFFGFSVFFYMIIFALFNYLNQAIGLFPSFLVPLFSTENMQAAFLKLPSIFADLGIGYLIYQIIQKKNPEKAWFWTILYLFNPAVIYISAVWGQIESVPIFFLVLSFYLLPRRYYLSHLAFIFAALGKQTALWLLPVYLVVWAKRRGAKELLQGLTLQAVVFVLVYFPFTLSLNPFSLYLATLSGSSTLVSDQAMNLWHFIFQGARLADSIKLLGISVRIWSLSLLALSYLYVCLRLWRHFSIGLAANSLFFLSIAAFFLQTRVHERHLAPALPFLLLTTFKPKTKVTLYAFLSVYHLFNLYTGLRLPFI